MCRMVLVRWLSGFSAFSGSGLGGRVIAQNRWSLVREEPGLAGDSV